MTGAAIVTGASGGIGRAVSRRLARDGFAVIVNYAGSASKAEATVGEIEAAGGRLDRAAVNAVLEAAGQTKVRAAAPRGLTERELDVLRLMARGHVDKEIAAELGISHRTVQNHNQNIFGKLGVTTRGAAALFAIEQGLV